jgi:hypothetical protein
MMLPCFVLGFFLFLVKLPPPPPPPPAPPLLILLFDAGEFVKTRKGKKKFPQHLGCQQTPKYGFSVL